MTLDLKQKDVTHDGVSLIRWLYSKVGFKRGLGRLVMSLAGRFEQLHLFPVSMSDGRILYLDLRLPMCMPYLLLGRHPYEQGETIFTRTVLRKNDVCLDIGANVGWYSTLLSEAVGEHGSVYAFDPNRRAQKMLNASALRYPQMHIVPLALSDHEGDAILHIPSEEVKASLWTSPGANEVQSCRMMTVDKFLKNEGISEVTFVKCDAEGSELSILRGSHELLGGSRPPMWMMEISPETNAWAGYSPVQLIEFFNNLPTSEFTGYSINSQTGDLTSLPDSIESVLYAVFVPRWLQERIKV